VSAGGPLLRDEEGWVYEGSTWWFGHEEHGTADIVAKVFRERAGTQDWTATLSVNGQEFLRRVALSSQQEAKAWASGVVAGMGIDLEAVLKAAGAWP
jgi:hypothetical protein